MNRKKWWFSLIEIAILLIIVVVVIYNAFKNENFWDFSLPQALTLIVAIVFAFGATQFRNDVRKSKEQAEKVICKIQNIVNQSTFYEFSSSGIPDDVYKQNRLDCRKLNNCMTVLKEYAKTLNFVDEVEYIDREIKEYNDFVSEHPKDLEYLSKSEGELKKRADNIDSKCDQIIVKLYK